jgi:hypothetical protein
MTAEFEETRMFEVNGDIDLFDACEKVAKESGFNIKSIDKAKGQIVARTNLNWKSWTETVNITVRDSGNVTVNSTCTFPMQMIDWGKNATNVNLFFTNLLSNVAEMNGKKTVPNK